MTDHNNLDEAPIVLEIESGTAIVNGTEYRMTGGEIELDTLVFDYAALENALGLERNND